MRNDEVGDEAQSRDVSSPVGDARCGKSDVIDKRVRPSLLLTVLAFAAVYVIWGSTYLGIKYAIETLPPFLMSGSRFLLAGVALAAWALWRGERRPTLAHWRSASIVGALLFLGGNGGVVWAEQYIPSSLAALLVATEPLWIVLMNWLRPAGVRPALITFLGLAVGFAGVWLLIGGVTSGDDISGRSALGAGAVIGATLAWAAGSLYSLRADLPASAILSAGMQMIAGGAFLTIAATLTGEWSRLDLGSASTISVGAFLYLVVFGSIVAFTAYSWLLQNVSPAKASTYAYVNPVVAVALGWAIAGEAVTTRTLLATAVIVSSVALITLHKQDGTSPEHARPEGDGMPAGVACEPQCSK